MDTKPKRRWFRYSLRTLLVFVTLASAGFGWLGYKVRQSQQHREAIKTIEKLGGTFRYEGNPTNALRPAWLSKWIGNDDSGTVIQVRFDSRIGDDVLAQLQSLTRLDRLDVHGTQVTDAG